MYVLLLVLGDVRWSELLQIDCSGFPGQSRRHTWIRITEKVSKLLQYNNLIVKAKAAAIRDLLNSVI